MGKAKPKPPPSVKPWPCVILAIDCAKHSGWARWDNGELHSSGEVDIENEQGLWAICHAAVAQPAHASPMEAVIVFEKPWASGHASAYMGLGAARFAWMQAWKAAGGNVRRVVKVHPQTWRSSVLGFTRGPSLRDAEICRAAVIAGVRTLAREPDRAAAILIGKWATHAGEVGAVLPAKLRKAVA